MIRLKRLGDVEFENPLFLQEQDEKVRAVSQQKFKTIDGRDVIFSQLQKSFPYTFSSNEIAWNSKQIKEDLEWEVFFNLDFSFEVEIQKDKNQTETFEAIFDFSDGDPVISQPLFEGSDLYFISIKLLRVDYV